MCRHNCVSLGVYNTSVNAGKHRSFFVEARKLNPHIMLIGCPCHIAHNTAMSLKIVLMGLIKELRVNHLFYFDYSKRENLLAEFCLLCDQEYHKIIKFHSDR